MSINGTNLFLQVIKDDKEIKKSLLSLLKDIQQNSLSTTKTQEKLNSISQIISKKHKINVSINNLIESKKLSEMSIDQLHQISGGMFPQDDTSRAILNLISTIRILSNVSTLRKQK